MEVTGLTIMSKDFRNKRLCNYKNMVFVKFDDKVFVEVQDDVSSSVVLDFDDFVKNEYLHTYYELSLAAIGKPNIDDDYFGCNNPDYIPTEYELYVDTIYIVEDAITRSYIAKKGNTHQSLNLENIKNTNVSTDSTIEEFFENYNKKYGSEKENFEEKKKLYVKLLDKL
jgi:hypothetical protein